MFNEDNSVSFRLHSFRRKTNFLDLLELVPILKNLNQRYLHIKDDDTTGAIVWERMSNGYRIASLEENRFLDALRLIRERFFESEPLCRATNLSNDIASMRTYLEIIYKKMSDMQSFCAVRECDNKLVGVVVASINEKGDHIRSETRTRPYQGEALFNIMTLKSCVFSRARPYEILKINQFFRVHGFCVDVEHQGKGIGTALINTCVDLARTLLAPACIVGSSSSAARIIASKLEFQILAEVPYKNFKVYNDEAESWEYPFKSLADNDGSMACMALAIPLPSVPSPLPSIIETVKKKEKKNVRTKSNSRSK